MRKLDPFPYLEGVLRVLPYGPREWNLELAPKHWAVICNRLNPDELAMLISAFEVSSPLSAAENTQDAALPAQP